MYFNTLLFMHLLEFEQMNADEKVKRGRNYLFMITAYMIGPKKLWFQFSFIYFFHAHYQIITYITHAVGCFLNFWLNTNTQTSIFYSVIWSTLTLIKGTGGTMGKRTLGRGNSSAFFAAINFYSSLRTQHSWYLWFLYLFFVYAYVFAFILSY